jgi:hypothetical protein
MATIPGSGSTDRLQEVQTSQENTKGEMQGKSVYQIPLLSLNYAWTKNTFNAREEMHLKPFLSVAALIVGVVETAINALAVIANAGIYTTNLTLKAGHFVQNLFNNDNAEDIELDEDTKKLADLEANTKGSDSLRIIEEQKRILDGINQDGAHIIDGSQTPIIPQSKTWTKRLLKVAALTAAITSGMALFYYRPTAIISKGTDYISSFFSKGNITLPVDVKTDSVKESASPVIEQPKETVQPKIAKQIIQYI